MCNPKTIEEAADTRRQQAARDYFAAVWRGDGPEAILSLATAAGRTPAEASADAEAATRAHKFIEESGRLIKARRVLACAESKRRRAEDRLKAATAKLLPRAEAAGFAVDDARRAVEQVDAAAHELLKIWRERPDLVPTESLPAAVNELLQGEKRDAQRLDLQRRRVAAGRILEAARERVREAQVQPVMTTHYAREEIMYKRRLAEAEEALRLAEAQYVEADKAFAQAGS
jgi:hypothetical protein